MRKFWFSIGIFLLMVLFYTVSLATTYYVKNAGSDALSGTSEANAWQHIDKASLTLVAGDTVLIMGGTYDEISATGGCVPSPCGTIRPANSGSSGSYITYKAHPDYAMPVIKGGSWERYACDLGDRNYIVIDGLEVTESFRGIVTNNSSYIIIQNCKIHDTAGPLNDNSPGILIGYVSPAPNVIVRNNICYRNWEWNAGHTARQSGMHTGGILAYRSSNCLVEDNVVYDQEEGYGIFLKYLDTTFVVRNNLIHDVNIGIGQGLDGGWSDIYENIIYNTAEEGIVLQANVWNMRIWNNTIWNSNGSGIKLYPCPSPQFDSIPTCSVWNNIVANCYGNIETYENWTAQADNHPDLMEDYNCYFDDFENIVVHWHGVTYTVAQYQAATIYGDHDIQQYPMFVDTAGHDFHLQAGSPCEGTGKDGEDMGAYPSGTPPVSSGAHKAMIKK